MYFNSVKYQIFHIEEVQLNFNKVLILDLLSEINIFVS